MQKNGTWLLVPPRLDINILPNKWVFKIKRKSYGSIDRYKTCLVANGFHQQEGIDYTETFSPVVKHTTIRIILALVVHHKRPIRQLDVHNAFFMVFYLRRFICVNQPALVIQIILTMCASFTSLFMD